MPLSLARPPTIAGPETAPAVWARRLAGYAWERQAIGMSQASTFRLAAPGKLTLFVKAEPSGLFCEIMNEANRLKWMREAGLPVPEVLGLEAVGGWHWLLTSALAGEDMSRRGQRLPNEIIALAVEALQRLHAVPLESCPFDHRLGRRLADARSRVAVGRVDPRAFDHSRRGKTASQLLDELFSRRPRVVEPVITHGDACLPNFIADAQGFVGYVDCGRLGVADRYQDIALLGGSIGDNLGVDWIEPFYEACGLAAPDRERIEFYLLLDEFF